MHAFIAGAWVLLVGGWALWVRAWLWRIELSRQLSSVLPESFRWLPDGFRAEVRAMGKIGNREWVLCWRVGWLGVRTFLVPVALDKKSIQQSQKEITVAFEDQLKPSVLVMALQATAVGTTPGRNTA